MIEIAGDDDEKKMKTGVNQTMQTPQGAPLQQKPSVGEQFGQLAMNRAMEGTLNAGETALTGALTGSAPTTSSIATPLMKSGVDASLANAAAGKAVAGAGTGGAMAALGTAMPYVGMGLLAGKAFGLFNKGGIVPPMYKHMGGPMMDDMYNRDNRMMRDRGTPPMNTTKMNQVQRGPFSRRPFNRPTNTFPRRPSVDSDMPMRNMPRPQVDPSPDPMRRKNDMPRMGGK